MEVRILQSFFDPDVPVAHVLTDLAGTYLSVDDAYCEILGRERTELIGRVAVQFTNPVEQARHTRAIAQLRDSGAPLTISKSYVRSDGKLMRVQNRASVVSDGIGPQRLVATVRPLADAMPIGTLESNFITVTRMLRARRGRSDAFGAERFAGAKWDIALACFKLECVGPRLSIGDICREIGLDPTSGALDVLDMVARGDLEIENAGCGLEDSSVRTSTALQAELARYLSQYGGPPPGKV
ncbi:PAS domain-containing protein [Sphingomonas sp. CARO-RG-8B-R24-01]|uniref:PAS domain-containing protein n=1 Tax=Sphingomonas sp. CARO-RG-8B-R24-01 TaxID=2914831 RepID=UPI001F560DFC|nr:PAS domain-containing protein [Sphingomonas sp. CARO-RG-8B-R24-01]